MQFFKQGVFGEFMRTENFRENLSEAINKISEGISEFLPRS